MLWIQQRSVISLVKVALTLSLTVLPQASAVDNGVAKLPSEFLNGFTWLLSDPSRSSSSRV